MSGSFGLVFFVAVICGPIILLSVVADAQSTESESASCETSTLDEAVHLIREELKDVKLIRGDLRDVKSACASRQQQSSAVDMTSLSSCVPLLIQQKVDGSDFFNRSWDEFKVGFNDSHGNYWLGNELLSQLTLTGRYKLRVDLQASTTNSSWYYAEYSRFTVYGESRNYELLVLGYSGNAGDALLSHNGMMFTTYDRDNDPWTNSRFNDNCAVHNGGGFWHKACSRCGVNNVRGRGNSFIWSSSQYGSIPLQTSRMWLTC